MVVKDNVAVGNGVKDGIALVVAVGVSDAVGEVVPVLVEGGALVRVEVVMGG